MLLLLVFFAGVFLGKAWWPRKSQAQAMGISDGQEWGRVPSVLGYLQERLSDDQVVAKAKERLSRVASWWRDWRGTKRSDAQQESDAALAVQ